MAEASGSDVSKIDAAVDLPVFEVDPYQHLEYLGHGAYGYVDKVNKKQQPASINPSREPVLNQVYARKVVRVSSSQDKENLRQSVLNEFKILHRLNHRHIVKVSQIYQWKNCFSIIMNEVADCNLSEYLQSTDEMNHSVVKEERRLSMLGWPGCLIQGIDYLHEMRIKHKDLKPANILIKDKRVLIADFGISKDLIDAETTASLGTGGDLGTLTYCAPEVLVENNWRGRAADIYALGCVFLEIATVILTPKGGLQKWSLHREKGGSRLYSRSGTQILQWIYHLWGYHYLNLQESRGFEENDFILYGTVPADMSFLMLDPNARTRITARQMVELLQETRGEFYMACRGRSCHQCQRLCHSPNYNLPRHSVYKSSIELDYPSPPQTALITVVAPSWEAAKKPWLQYHMWW